MAFQTRRKYCFFKENNITEIDYKDVKLLKRFINDNGKIMPRRVTGTSATMHRKVVSAIKRARTIGLMPFIDNGSCLLYTSPSPRDRTRSRMPSSA